MKKARRKGFFRLSWGILVLAVAIYALNIILILQLISFFESSGFIARTAELFIFPANLFFENGLGIESNQLVNALTWGLEFFYAYFIACLLRRLMKIKLRL